MNKPSTYLKNSVTVDGVVLPAGTQVQVTAQGLLRCAAVIVDSCFRNLIGREISISTEHVHHNWTGRKMATTKTLVVPPRAYGRSGYILTDDPQPWNYLISPHRIIRKGTEVIVDGEIMLGMFAVTAQSGRIMWRVFVGLDALTEGLFVTK